MVNSKLDWLTKNAHVHHLFLQQQTINLIFEFAIARTKRTTAIIMSFQSHPAILTAYLVALFSIGSTNNSPHAVFSPHQYGILDSNITFSAKVVNANRDRYTVFWSETRWTSMEPRIYNVDLTKENNFQSNWTLDFPSSRFHIGNFSVTSNIIFDWGPFPIEFATELISFTLTDQFSGKISVNKVPKPRKDKGPFLVSTKNETEIKIQIDNPSILENATDMSWSWFENNTSIANTTGPVLRYNFTEAKTYEITSKLRATLNISNTTVVKYGNFSFNLSAEVPIMNVNVSGDTWYKNDGRLLRLVITCEGTGPYQYCLQLHDGAYNVTGNETCHGGGETTNDCEIYFAWLLGEGIHTLVEVIENDLGRYVNKTTINVYKVARVQPLSLILVPITCSLIALVLIIFGIGYFWENRKRFTVEVADFDFGQHDELPYMTFMERLRDAMSSSSIDRQRLILPGDEEPTLSGRRSS